MTATRPVTAANGPVAAAILACGFGCFALGALSVAADGSKTLAAALNFYKPAGPLSGVTTVAIALWIVAWWVLAARWHNRTLAFGRVAALAFALLGFALLLTFPPIGDMVMGR